VRSKFAFFLFQVVEGGKGEKLKKARKRWKKRRSFLKINELTQYNRKQHPPRDSFSLPKQAYERAEPKRGERSKATVASTIKCQQL